MQRELVRRCQVVVHRHETKRCHCSSCCRPPPPRHHRDSLCRRQVFKFVLFRVSESTDPCSCGICVFSLTLLSKALLVFFHVGTINDAGSFSTGLLVVSRHFWFFAFYVHWERSTAASSSCALCRSEFCERVHRKRYLRK